MLLIKPQRVGTTAFKIDTNRSSHLLERNFQDYFWLPIKLREMKTIEFGVASFPSTQIVRGYSIDKITRTCVFVSNVRTALVRTSLDAAPEGGTGVQNLFFWGNHPNAHEEGIFTLIRLQEDGLLWPNTGLLAPGCFKQFRASVVSARIQHETGFLKATIRNGWHLLVFSPDTGRLDGACENWPNDVVGKNDSVRSAKWNLIE